MKINGESFGKALCLLAGTFFTVLGPLVVQGLPLLETAIILTLVWLLALYYFAVYYFYDCIEANEK